MKTELLLAELDSVQSEIVELNEKIKTLNVNKKIKGTIVWKYTKCGKKNCLCMKGGRPHGPYPHLQWWEKGKLKTKYLNSDIYPGFRKEYDDTKLSIKLNKQIEILKQKEKDLLNNII
ncbi:MAG: hypothetical protein PHN69_05225 [Candidatus Pacebacteria bacterium]|nr:hypothetical protein [Candidatus Paceibacterota bacterium]